MNRARAKSPPRSVGSSASSSTSCICTRPCAYASITDSRAAPSRTTPDTRSGASWTPDPLGDRSHTSRSGSASSDRDHVDTDDDSATPGTASPTGGSSGAPPPQAAASLGDARVAKWGVTPEPVEHLFEKLLGSLTGRRVGEAPGDRRASLRPRTAGGRDHPRVRGRTPPGRTRRTRRRDHPRVRGAQPAGAVGRG